MRSILIANRSHHAASLLNANKALGEAKGLLLSVRIAAGSLTSLKTRSNTVNAKFDLLSMKLNSQIPSSTSLMPSPALADAVTVDDNEPAGKVDRRVGD